ncbi:MAG: nucleotide exchange factor GrpE [Burkholderiales bacterium]
MSDAAPNSTASATPGEPAPAAEKTLDQLLAEAQARLEEQNDARLRAIAEADNARKRAQAEVQAARKFALERMAESLLPVMDSLEAALQAAEGAPQTLRDGLEITLKQLRAAFQQAGLAEIAPAPGERFDPHLHQAMAAVSKDDAEPNSIVAVVLKGYRLHDRVVRPALLTVAKALENKEIAPTSDANPASN